MRYVNLVISGFIIVGLVGGLYYWRDAFRCQRHGISTIYGSHDPRGCR